MLESRVAQRTQQPEICPCSTFHRIVPIDISELCLLLQHQKQHQAHQAEAKDQASSDEGETHQGLHKEAGGAEAVH